MAGAEDADREPVTLVLSTLAHSDEGSPNVERRSNFLLYQRFRKLHPWINFEQATDLALPPNMDFTGAQMAMSMVAGTAPDVFLTNQANLGTYARQGFCYPLDDLIDAWPDRDRVLGRYQFLFEAPGPKGETHIYAVPYIIGSSALVYSRRAFAEAGLDPYSGFDTWDELYAGAKALTDWTPDEYGVPKRVGMRFSMSGWMLIHLTPLAGGEWCYQGDDGLWHATVNEEACVRAFDFMRKLAVGRWERGGQAYRGVIAFSAEEQGKAATGPASRMETRDLFAIGRIGIQTTSFYYAFNANIGRDPDDFGVFRFPRHPSGRYANSSAGNYYSISSQIRDPRKLEAAWTFLSWMGGTEAERYKTEIYVEHGAANRVNPLILRTYGYADLVETVPTDWRLAYERIFDEDVYLQPNPPNATAIAGTLEQTVKLLHTRPDMDAQAALDIAQERISRSVLYSPTDAEMARNRRIALVAVIVLGAGVVAGGAAMIRMWIRANREALQVSYVGRMPLRRTVLAWSLMLPAIASVFLWQYVPVAWGSVMAFMDYRVLAQSSFIGLDNFIKVAVDPVFRIAVGRTVVYVAISLAMGFLVPVVLALLLSEVPRFKILWRTMYYMPALTVGVVTALLWKQFYLPTEQGLLNIWLTKINDVLALLHVPFQFNVPVKWLLSKVTVLPAVILPRIWAGMGPGCIIYLAALKSIPEEEYEAADLDGAGPWRKAFHVTLPGLAPLILINFLGSFIGAFHSMGGILIMTGGGPDYGSHVLSLEIFKQAYLMLEYGHATAIAWMLASCLIGFTVLQMRVISRMRFTRAEGV